jgi:hypothetical protein
MDPYRKIAEGLGLKDIGEVEFGQKFCECGARLRKGRKTLPQEKANETFLSAVVSYCPECRKRTDVVRPPTFTVRSLKDG